MTIKKDHHWMSYTPHYIVEVKFTKEPRYIINMLFMHVPFERGLVTLA
jgi:hypothetical protein